MAEPLEHFKLPREDWYDEAIYDSKGNLIDAGGRLYKDALIENFNAIEQKLLELARISFVDSQVVDVSTIEFPDVTLEDEDNRIINLRSFMNIMNLTNYPLELTFSGKTCTKLTYYKDDLTYVSKSKIKVDCSDNKPYIYLDYVNEDLIASSSSVTPEGCKFIAFYTDDQVVTFFTNEYIDINALFYLSKMSINTYARTYYSSTGEGSDRNIGYVAAGKWLGGADTNTGTQGINSVIYTDIGRRVGR